MRKLKVFAIRGIVLAAVFSGCGTALTPAPEMPIFEDTPAAGLPATEPQPTTELSTFEPQPIEFQSSDGTQLVGTYWPPAQSPAPGVILMHMMGKDEDSWQPLPALLQGIGLAHEGTQVRSYAVFTFDFRGHGESGGSANDRTGMLEDAKAALVTFKTLSGVNPERIVLIGASIGADAAVDVCGEGCIGAVSLSPGGFLGTNYNDALLALGNKPVLCVASESDVLSAETCKKGEQVGLADYRMQLYTGGSHGTDMLAISDQQPMLTDLIFEWLAAH